MDVDAPPMPSEIAVLTALFGWTIVLPTAPSEPTKHTSISRSSSITPSIPSTPIRSRPSLPYASRSSTPVLGSPRFPQLQRETSTVSVANVSLSALTKVKADATLLFCPLCQRRIGLWAFVPSPQTNGTPTPLPSGPSLAGETSSLPRRQLDVLKEHRSYCPYVVKSTILPSFPVPPASRPVSRAEPYTLGANPSLSQVNGQSAVEGWRAAMSIVLRYGAAQKQRMRRTRSVATHSATVSTEDSEARMDEEVMPEMNQVDQMVEGVKARGVRVFARWNLSLTNASSGKGSPAVCQRASRMKYLFRDTFLNASCDVVIYL